MTSITIDFIYYTSSSNFASSKSFISPILHYMLIGEYFYFIMNECLRVDFPELILKVCEIMIDNVVIEVNMILFGMYAVDVILKMNWLFNHGASMDCFTKKIVLSKSGYLELEFEGDQRILPTCVILILEAKRLLHKRCEAYLAHVINKSFFEITLDMCQ